MSIRVAAWNVERGLGNKHQGRIFDGIKQLDSDIVVVSEAYGTDDTTSDELREDINGRIADFSEQQGYDYTQQIAYEEYDKRSLEESPKGYETYLMVLGRQAIKGTDSIRLGGRNALSLDIIDDQTNIKIKGIAAHFDDRNESLRQSMVHSLVENLDTNNPSILMGDLNALHANSWPARLLQTDVARLIANLSITKHMKLITNRAIEMSDGSVMRDLVDLGLRDADIHHNSTYKLGFITFGQLDHIMVAKLGVVDGSFKVNNFRGSDHKAISATIYTDHRFNMVSQS